MGTGILKLFHQQKSILRFEKCEESLFDKILPFEDKLMITKDVIAEKTANTPMVVSFKFRQEKKDITRKKVIPFRTETKDLV